MLAGESTLAIAHRHVADHGRGELNHLVAILITHLLHEQLGLVHRSNKTIPSQGRPSCSFWDWNTWGICMTVDLNEDDDA